MMGWICYLVTRLKTAWKKLQAALCREKLCKVKWQRDFLIGWDNIRRSGAKKKAARVVRRKQPVEDKPISHREYVFGHILTAGWRDVK